MFGLCRASQIGAASAAFLPTAACRLAVRYGARSGSGIVLDARHTEDPLAWPYFATADDLAGLPPHVITVNELDPLRDEGLAYYRKLLAAGVPAEGRINLGITHGAEMIFRQALPAEHRAAIADIRAFVDRLSVDHI